MRFFLGSGVTTSLISLIANAGQADQAIATAGNSPNPFLFLSNFQTEKKFTCSIIPFPLPRFRNWIVNRKHTHTSYPTVYASQKAFWC